jgi:type IV pilus assembly protein PilA
MIMRAIKRFSRAGFTLVELMIVVAIIGILAALAIYGVRRYLQSAKTAEAKNSLGAMGRGAIGAFEREETPPEALTEGTLSSQFTHDICGAAAATVPVGTPPSGKKYQPSGIAGADYDNGDSVNGWKCLKFTMTNPQYYLYGYQGNRFGTGGSANTAVLTTVPAMPALPATSGAFRAYAHGDLDGDGVYSGFSMGGSVTPSRIAKLDTEMATRDEFE